MPADFDRDGWMDVAYTLPSPGSVRLARNTGNAPAGWTDTLAASGLSGVALLATGEYGTPDGEPDLFTGNATTGQIRGLYQSNGVWSGQNIYSSLTPVPQSLATGQGSSARGHEVAFLSSGATSLNLRTMHLSGGWNVLGPAGGRTETVTGGQHSAKVIWATINGNSRSQEAVYIDGAGRLTAWTPSNNGVFHLGTVPGEIRDITATDWDQDGLTDVLATTDEGLSLFHYQRSDSDWHRTDLYTAVGGFYSVTVLNLNGDAYPDAVVDHAGVLEYYLNDPQYTAKADLASVPAQITLPASGGLSLAITVPLSSAGRPAGSNGLADLPLAVTGAEISFHHAVPGPNGTWVVGGTTNASSYCTTAALRSGIATIASTSPQNATAFLNNTSAAVPTIAAGTSLDHALHLAIPVSAAQGANPRFIIRLARLQTATVNGGALAGFSDDVLITNNHDILVNIVPANATPLQQWRAANFGTWQSTGTAANDADPDGDGVRNLVEYFTGTNPNAREQSLNTAYGLTLLTNPDRTVPASLRVFGTTTALADPKLRVTIQFATSNLNAWNLYATRTGGGSWSGVTLPTVFPPSAGRSNIFFTTNITPQGTPKYFVRLKLEELP